MAIACVRPYGAFSAAAQCPHNLIIGRNSHVPPHFICLAQPRQACLATCQTMPAVPCQTPEEGVAPLWHCQRDLSRCVGRSCCRLRRYRFALIARTGGEQRRIALRSDTAPALRWLANAVRRSCSMKPSACIGPRPARATTTSGMARQHCLRRSKSPPKDHRGAFKTASAHRVSRLHEQRHRGLSGPLASRHPRQPQHPLEKRALAQGPPQRALTFHANKRVLAQSGRGMVLDLQEKSLSGASQLCMRLLRLSGYPPRFAHSSMYPPVRMHT